MLHNPFPVRLRAASIVPRWSIVHTQKPDYVAGHSFYVAIYSKQIADLIGYSGSHSTLLWYALIHDLDELIVGDIVAPVKRHIIDAANASRFISAKMAEMLPGVQRAPVSIDIEEIKLIVKAADQLDALFFALGEQALGNQIIAARIPSCYDKLREAWFKLPMSNTEGYVDLENMLVERFLHEAFSPVIIAGRVPKRLADLWLDVVVPAINEHRDPKRYDIE